MAPTICRKNGATPNRPSSRPSRSISAVTANAVAAMTGPPPSSTATAAAWPAQPNVATQRG